MKSTILSPRAPLAALAALTLTTAIAFAPAASAVSVTAPSSGDQSLAAWTPYLMAQAPLDSAAQRILAAAGPSSGFTSVAISVPQRTVTVYWKGHPTTAASQVFARARAGGIRVAVHPAKYSRAELTARTTSITATTARYQGEGYRIRTIEPRQDGSGLDVGVENVNSAAPSVKQIPSPSMTQLATQLGADVRVVPARHSEATDRFNDLTPHWAGARIIRNDGAELCSSGWPIRRNSDGRTFILTADHCGGSSWWAAWRLNDPNNNYKFGDVWDHNSWEDAETIRSVVQGDTYDGGVKIGTEFNKPVSGSALGHVKGLVVCQSGSFSGAHCGLTVTGWATEWIDAGYFVNVVYDYAGNGEAVAKGDSGGPIFTLDPNNSSRVIARGLQSTGEGNSYSWYNNNGEQLTAFHTGGFTDIQAILSDFGASIITG